MKAIDSMNAALRVETKITPTYNTKTTKELLHMVEVLNATIIDSIVNAPFSAADNAHTRTSCCRSIDAITAELNSRGGE